MFAEYTTTSKKVFSKFRDDIAKCLNEEKTGVPITKIREIVVANLLLSYRDTNLLSGTICPVSTSTPR
jgi:hypothetical protein